MFNLPVAVRTLRDFIGLVRKQDWGGWLVGEPLTFYRGSTELGDTVCLVSVGMVEPVEVLPASVAYQGQPSGVAAERREQTNSGALSRAQQPVTHQLTPSS